MKILLWGPACVGKSDIGKLLAKKLNYKFINITDIIKEKYGTMDKFNCSFICIYELYLEKEKLIMDVINNNDNFVLVVSAIFNKRIVKRIVKNDIVSVVLMDYPENIYDRILFYDENDKVMSDSKEYRDAHREHYMKEVKEDIRFIEDKCDVIPKFEIQGRKFEDIINELNEFICDIYRGYKIVKIKYN